GGLAVGRRGGEVRRRPDRRGARLRARPVPLPTALLKGGPKGDLLVALYEAQSLDRRRRSFTWKSVGVEAVGRSQRLDRNYRNTKQILEFAWQVGRGLRGQPQAGRAAVAARGPEGAAKAAEAGPALAE